MSAAERRRIPIFALDSNPWDPQTPLDANKKHEKVQSTQQGTNSEYLREQRKLYP